MILELSFLPTNPIMKVVFGVGAFILAGILYLLFKFVILVLIRMNHYKKQGAPCYFRPMIGQFGMMMGAFDEHGDFYYYSKRGSKENPTRFFCTNMGDNPYIILHDTALIKEFYLNNDNYVKEQLSLDFFPYLLGQGLVIAEGTKWRAQKKMLSSTFHFEFLNSFLPVIQKIAIKRLSALKKNSLKDFDIMQEMQNISGDIVGKMFFGEEVDQYTFEGKPLTDALSDLINETFTANGTLERHIFGLWLIQFMPKHKKMIKKIDDFRNTCSKFVQMRKEELAKQGGGDKKDMLQVLVEYSGKEEKLKDMDYVDQFLSFFLPGLDTTGHLLTMSIYYLAKNPEIKAKVLAEYEEYRSSGRPLTIEELNKLEFTSAFLKEVLRTSTPLNDIFARKCIKDHNLKDLHIKKGDVVNVDYYYNNYNSEFFKDPFKFDPTRWLSKEKSLDPYCFTPFSAGPRTCIGQHLAMNETKIILMEYLLMYDWNIKEGYELKTTLKFLYGPAEPILVNMTPK